MIRLVKMKDAAALCQINADVMGYAVSQAFTEQQISLIMQDMSHHFMAVYVDDENPKVVGYVHAELYRELYAKDALNVLALAVQSNQQGRGIGKQLMHWLEQVAVKHDIHAIRLNSGANRTKAHEFYQHLGFEEIKLQKKFVKKV